MLKQRLAKRLPGALVSDAPREHLSALQAIIACFVTNLPLVIHNVNVRILQMQNEEQIKEVKKDLAKDRDERNELLSKARDFHYDKLISLGRDYSNYIVKLGELSFLIGAAIVPIIIASGEELKYPKFIFFAVVLYLFNGVLAMWKSKDIVEKNLDAFAPGNLHALEIKVQPLQFLANKIILDFKAEDIAEYIDKEKIFIEENSEEKTTENINVFLDVLVLFFILPSLLIVRVVWPFADAMYWHFFGILISIILSVIVFGIFKAKSTARANAKNTRELNQMKLEYAKWWKEKMCKDEK